jgi:N6-adenosine-specific RNA methylase IME4
MNTHKYATLFPMASENELNEMAEDIKNNGLKNHIVLLDDQILDGRNRYEACMRANVEPLFVPYLGNDPLGDVISWNLHRRHLTTSQRAALAVEMEPMFEAAAKKNMKCGGGDQKSGLPKLAKAISEPVHAREKAAAAVKVSHGVVCDAKEIRSKSPELFEKVKSGEMKVNEAKREIKKQEYQEKVKQAENKKEIPTGPFQLILADPPWQYDFSETQSREVENQYQTANVSEICKHKPDAANDCILLLWATAPKLKEAIDVFDAWGFEYKTHAIWDKQKIGMGYWFRGQHELLLVGTKGKVSPPNELARVSSIFSEARGKHSAKPECVYAWIEKAFPLLSKLEMYSRNNREGWVVTGNEV